MELEDAGGIEILSDTLKDDNASEEEKSEAAGLLAQVTSPWIENNNTIEGLSRHLNDLVQSLTSKYMPMIWAGREKTAVGWPTNDHFWNNFWESTMTMENSN